MSTADKDLHIRVSDAWLSAVDAAAAKLSADTGAKISRSAYVKLAVTKHIEAAGQQ